MDKVIKLILAIGSCLIAIGKVLEEYNQILINQQINLQKTTNNVQ